MCFALLKVKLPNMIDWHNCTLTIVTIRNGIPSTSITVISSFVAISLSLLLVYVDQTVRHLTTRSEEHRKEDTPVGQHIRQCGSESGKSESKWKIIDQASGSINLLTLEALHIRKERPAINKRVEFRSRELTLWL